ncbi:MAG TPA: phenylalanine--tRNA ligase subunit beta [Candidatus Acidoferrales bacterium]|nr:phenylalanine--tRNA ligase subunit beta [Candidatus Acidoferrales bacterium]
MPVVKLCRDELEEMVGYDAQSIVEVLPMLGADIECVSDEIEVEFFPNRPDLLSVEGAARAVKGMLEVELGLPLFETVPSGITIEVNPSVNIIRPYIVCGVIKGINVDDKTIKSIVDLQEDLHWGVGRNRRKAAIGVHDMSKIEPPFRYTLGNIAFVPLDFTEPLTPSEILQVHPKGREYAHIVRDHHPLILDSDGQVLSFPPIINGELTRVTEKSTDLLIEVTGLDLKAVMDCLNILVTALHDRGGKIETVDVVYTDENEVIKTPDTTEMMFNVNKDDVVSRVGLQIDDDAIVRSLSKMRIGANIDRDVITAAVPCYRTDIMHPVDIIEDIAIGYGYNNIPFSYPKLGAIGQKLDEEKRSSRAREIMNGLGYLEVITLMLAPSQVDAIIIENPISEEHISLRKRLIPGLIEILSLNQHREYPQKIYEVGDVVTLKNKGNGGDDEAEDVRVLAGTSTHTGANFTEVRATVSAVLREFDIPFEIAESKDDIFVVGRCADVIVNGKTIGVFGELDPNILVQNKLVYPAAAFEICL